MSAGDRIQAIRRLLQELSAAVPSEGKKDRVQTALADLDELSLQLQGFIENNLRLQEVADALFGMASLDFSHRPEIKGDESVLDAVIGCVNMLSEELAAYLEQRTAIEQELERRVEARTAELRSANAQLRREIEERIRTEEALSQSEEQLRQAAKMEAVGRLSGGIAHDFNNLLSVILSYTSGLIDELPAGNPMREDLEEIRRAGMRASDLTRQLLAFSRRQVLELKIVDLNDLITSTASMLQRLVGEDVELKLELDPRPGKVRVDPGQIVQVLMNLSVNARDAMPSGGTLTLGTAHVEQMDARAAPHRELPPGPCVVMRVSDTGVGMDKATLARIFEPFFTTKGPGAGTGLGLATVFGIVRQSGGTIHVQSEPGKGTTFESCLPRSDGAVQSTGTSPASPRGERGSETILLVEDDEQVRHLVQRTLEHHGYQVLSAARPPEALVLFQQHRDSIALLLTDVVMPQMSGRQLAEQMLASRPELKVLYMSGYTEDVSLRHGIVEASVSFLQKPITPHELLQKLREVLDR